VFCAFCFANFPSPGRIVREMIRILRPRGFLAIMDIVAPGVGPQLHINALEKSRTRCRMRILTIGQFCGFLSRLPLQWRSRSFRQTPITFRLWAAASCLRTRTPAFGRAERLFRSAVAIQNCKADGVGGHSYRYLVARFLLQKSARVSFFGRLACNPHMPWTYRFASRNSWIYELGVMWTSRTEKGSCVEGYVKDIKIVNARPRLGREDHRNRQA
jgi:SAM-dependent methyltransferase